MNTNLDYKEHQEFKGSGCVDGFGSNDFDAEKVAGRMTKEYLTDEDFKTGGDIPYLIHQSWSDFCIACQVAYESMKSEGTKTSWSGMFKLIMKMLGYLTEFGTSVENGCKARIKLGIPEEKYDEWHNDKSRKFNADPKNLSAEALQNSKNHKGKSYLRISPSELNMFDSIRGWLNKYKDKNLYIKGGIDNHAWGVDRQYTVKESGDTPIFNDIKQTNNDLIKAGLKVGEMYLIGADSYGEESKKYRFGKSVNGWRYWTEKDMNQNYYAYFTLDVHRTLAELLNKYANKAIMIQGEDPVFYVENGEKHWIPDHLTAWCYNVKFYEEVEKVSKSEMETIPEGDHLDQKKGELYRLFREVMNTKETLKFFNQDLLKKYKQ
jgi:hypothetical protein